MDGLKLSQCVRRNLPWQISKHSLTKRTRGFLLLPCSSILLLCLPQPNEPVESRFHTRECGLLRHSTVIAQRNEPVAFSLLLSCSPIPCSVRRPLCLFFGALASWRFQSKIGN